MTKKEKEELRILNKRLSKENILRDPAESYYVLYNDLFDCIAFAFVNLKGNWEYTYDITKDSGLVTLPLRLILDTVNIKEIIEQC